MNRTIAIVSGKGGVGKSVVTLNLCAALLELKRNAIALDADVKMCGLGLQLGIYYFPLTLNDVLAGKASLLDALYIHPTGIRIIPASLSTKGVKISRLKNVLEGSFLDNSILLVDSPPGFESNALAVLRACKEFIVVTLPELPAIANVLKIAKLAEKFKTEPIGIIVNRYKKGEEEQISVKEIESACGIPVIGVIPEDKVIRKSIFRKVPAVLLDPFAPASLEFKRIAASLARESYEPPKFLFLKRLLRRIGK